MPPFGSSDFNDGFFESLPPLELSKTPMAASTLFLEPLDALEAPEKFVLAFVDDSGEPIRAATEADLVNLLEGDASKAPEAKQEEQSAALTEAEFKSLLRQPVCRHCGVTESPQWRRGPPAKPILCNACGTRYRRTGQLNHAAQNAKKRATHSDCAREMVSEKGRAMKQPRVVA